MSIVTIVQARLGSRRLPHKILMPIADRPMISYVLERCLKATKVSQVILAMPWADSKEIVKHLDFRDDKLRIMGFENVDENDVAYRYRAVLGVLARRAVPSAFLRVCADSPLIDWVLMDWMISQWDGKNLTCNFQPRTFPPGQCIEIMPSVPFMRQGDKGFTESDREHVTQWYYRHAFYKNVTNPLGDFSSINQCVDTPEDFECIKAVIEKMDRNHLTYGWQEMVEMMA